MKKYVIIPIFLAVGITCGWVNDAGMEENVICGEIMRYIEECEPCVLIYGCDGEEYRLFAPLDPKCRFVKITNPVWGTVSVQCPVESEGEVVMFREVRAWCITSYSSIKCIDSCEKCDDPCADVHCSPECVGCDLWATKCVDGECVQDYIAGRDSVECGCGAVCGAVCVGQDLWSQKRVNGNCVLDALIEPNSTACGYNPCENHCDNGKKDCGEHGVDCGGGCPFKDSDHDSVEDCIDKCPNSRCNRVDMNGCETDVDADGVMDCEDECPTEKGDASNNGCPAANVVVILAGIGGAAAAGSAALYGIKGGKLFAKSATKKMSTEMAEAASKKVSTEMAEAATKSVSTEIAEAASKKAGEKIAEAAIGAGVTGTVAKTQEGFISCPQCGENLSPDSKFCSKCGHEL